MYITFLVYFTPEVICIKNLHTLHLHKFSFLCEILVFLFCKCVGTTKHKYIHVDNYTYHTIYIYICLYRMFPDN